MDTPLVLPEFKPSDAGQRAVNQTFDALDGGQSLMDRAQKMQASQFDLDERKQMLAGDLALQSYKVDEQRLLTTQRQNEVRAQDLDLQVRQHQADADASTADNLAALQKSIATSRTMNSARLLTIPDQIQDIINTPNTPENQQVYLQKVNAFQASTATLASDPYHSGQFHALVAPLVSDSQSRGMAFQAHTRDASARLRAQVTSASSPEQLSTVASDPWFSYAARADYGGDPEFLKAYEEKQKQLSDLQQKKYEVDAQRLRQDREQGLSMSNNVANSQDVQTFNKVKAAYDDAVNQLGTATPTNYSDMAALTAFFKIIDPTMGFNASQEQIFAGLQPYAQRLGINLRNVFYNGGILTPESRTALKSALTTSFEPHQEIYRDRVRQAGDALRSQGINPAGLLPDIDQQPAKPVDQVSALRAAIEAMRQTPAARSP